MYFCAQTLRALTAARASEAGSLPAKSNHYLLLQRTHTVGADFHTFPAYPSHSGLCLPHLPQARHAYRLVPASLLLFLLQKYSSVHPGCD